MNFVQKIRNFLDLIYDYRSVFGICRPGQSQTFFPEQRRLMHETPILVRKKQIIAFRSRITLLEQGALSRLARSPKETARSLR
jgi:hypothetical protein